MSNNDNKIDDKNRNVPALRFEGFTDPWVQCKLSEIVKPIRRKNKNNEANIPLTISDIYGIIDQRDYFNRQVASKDLSNYTLLLNGDFAYNKSYSTNNHFGTVARLDNYESGALSTLYITFRPQFILSDFLMFYYKSSKWHEEIYKIAAEGARNHGLLNIFTDDFFSTKLIIPREDLEQDKISKLLLSLDSLITLEQEKLEQQKLFINEIFSNLIKVRSNEWTEVHLSEIVNIKKGEQIKSEDIDDKGEYYHLNGGIEPSNYTNKYNRPENTISISEGGNSCGFVKWNEEKFWSGGHNYTLEITKKIEPYFLFTVLKLNQKQIERLRVGSGLPNIQKKDLERMKIKIADYSEQMKISNIYRYIDYYFNQKEEYITTLEKLKQYLLQNLFA